MTCFASSFLSEGFSATSIICVGPGSGLYHIRASTLLREYRAATIVCFVMVWVFVCASRTHLHGPARSLSLSLSLSLSRLLLLTLWGPVWFLLLVCLVSCLPFFSCAEPVWFLLLLFAWSPLALCFRAFLWGRPCGFCCCFSLGARRPWLLVFACPCLLCLVFCLGLALRLLLLLCRSSVRPWGRPYGFCCFVCGIAAA